MRADEKRECVKFYSRITHNREDEEEEAKKRENLSYQIVLAYDDKAMRARACTTSITFRSHSSVDIDWN